MFHLHAYPSRYLRMEALTIVVLWCRLYPFEAMSLWGCIGLVVGYCIGRTYD